MVGDFVVRRRNGQSICKPTEYPDVIIKDKVEIIQDHGSANKTLDILTIHLRKFRG